MNYQPGNIGNMLPHNVQAEEAVLGSVLIDPAVLKDLRWMIDKDDFFIAKHQYIWQCMLEMHDRAASIDFLTLYTYMDKRGYGKDVQMAYLSHLSIVVPTSLHATGYAEIVTDLAVRRSIINSLSVVIGNTYNGNGNGQCLPDLLAQTKQIITRIEGRVLQADDDGDDSTLFVPELPDWARVDGQHLPVGKWLDDYINYSKAISPMAPFEFHESAGLWIAGLAIARRLRANMPFDEVYPNLFIAWVAPSTLWRKTTTLNVARRIVSRAIPHLLLSSDITPQQLLSAMAGTEPANKLHLPERDVQLWHAGRDYAAQRGICLDEMSGMMSSAGRDFNAGLIEYLMKFYNCEELTQRETRGEGLTVVRNSYLSFLGASTPMALSVAMNSEVLWSGGWWPRFALIGAGDCKPKLLDPLSEPPDADPIVNGIRRLYNCFQQPTWPDPVDPVDVIIEHDAYTAWHNYFRALYQMVSEQLLDSALSPLYGRLHIQALKVAMILAALDWSGGEWQESSPVVKLAHVARAIDVAERWRASSHRIMADVTMGENARFLQRVLSHVISAGEWGVTLRDLYKALSKSPYEVETALSQLLRAAEIEVVEMGSSRGGPRRPRYRRLSV